MTSAQFTKWLAEMRAANLIRFENADAARLLKVTPTAISLYKRKGTGYQTALACRALLHRLEPYS